MKPFEKKENNPSTIEYWLKRCDSLEEAEKKRKHNNRCNSCFCIEYWLKKGYTEKEGRKEITKIQKNNGKKSRSSGSLIPTQLQYWIKKGYSQEEAKQKLSERQSTFSKEKCIKKYGKEKGLQVWQNRQNKWQNTMKSKPKEEIERINKAKRFKNSYSKVSQELFWNLYSEIKDDFEEIYFAQLGPRKGKDITGKNHEYMLFFKDKSIAYPDFFIKDKRIVIEFDGTYWHNLNEIKENDKLRTRKILNEGYKLLHIAEQDWYDDNNEILKKCKEFIYGN